jgi:Trk K+ transport system NAD-binding subunit
MILYSQALFERVGPWLKFFERKAPTREREVDHVDGASQSPQVVIFGLGRYGTRLLERLESAGTRCLGVDFDPENVRAIAARGFTVRFGDAEDPALLESLSLGSAAWAVSTLPEVAPNRALLHALGEVGFRGRIAAVVRDVETHELFDEVNAPMVFHPYDDAADLAATRLVEALVEPS